MENNDYKLVYLAKEGNEDAIELIYKKYKPIIVKKSRNAIVFVNHHGVDINDIMQEAFIGLDRAIKSFSQDEDASFYTFALLCIDRQIANYLRRITNKKDKILNDAVYIDDTLEKVLWDGNNIENSFIIKNDDNIVISNIEKTLTDFEKKVFHMKLEGFSFEEIANNLNKDIKSIYNTFQRVKFKIKKNIKIDN